MVRTARGLGWHLWRRQRWGFLGLAAYIAAMAVAVRQWPGPLGGNLWFPLLIAMPTGGWLLYLLAAFSYAEADIDAPGSGHPTHLMLLPVRTAELVLWPMLLGTVTLAAAWGCFQALLFEPAGRGGSLQWPAAMLAALLAWLQAVVWMPLGVRHLRVVLIFAVLCGLLWYGLYNALNGMAEPLLIRRFLLLVPPAYLAAWLSLAAARRGDHPHLARPMPRGVPALRAKRAPRRPFRSPMEAQLWLEWSRNGRVLPLVVGAMCLVVTIPILLATETVSLERIWVLPLGPEGLRGTEGRVGLVWAQVPLLLTPLCALIVGCGLRKSDTRRHDLSLNPFLLTRPMASHELVAAKYRMAARSTMAAMAVLLGFELAWLLLPVRWRGGEDPLLAVLLSQLTPRGVVWLLLGLALYALITWRNQAQGLFVDLSGKPWLVWAYPVGQAVLGAFLFALLLTGYEVLWQRGLILFLPALAVALLALKLGAGVVAIRWVVREAAVPRPLVERAAAAWLVAAAGLFITLRWLAPFEAVETLYLAALTLMALPLTRITLAPLALSLNRHG